MSEKTLTPNQKIAKELAKSYERLTPKPPPFERKTTKQRNRETIPASVGTGVDQETQAPSVGTGNLWEVYRKVSSAIVTQEDIYEKPDDWDGTPSSPTWSGGAPDPAGSWLEIERVHEIGYLNLDTFEIEIEKFFVPNGEGPVLADNFSAKLSVTVNTPADSGFMPPASRIPTAFMARSNVQFAISQAQSEVNA